MAPLYGCRALSISNAAGVGARKALLVAIAYNDLNKKHPGENFRLSGAHKDPFVMERLLIDMYGYKKSDITILMDDGSGKYAEPTRENMVAHLKSLVENARPGDHFVFHFSGHGSQIECENGKEADGFDEVIWPSDVVYDPSEDDEHKRATNFIQDDDLKKILVDDLPDYSRLTVLFDCCHSGTSLDLPHHKATNRFDHKWVSPTSEKGDSLPFSEKCIRKASSDAVSGENSRKNSLRESVALIDTTNTQPRSSMESVLANVTNSPRNMSLDDTDDPMGVTSRSSTKDSLKRPRPRKRMSSMGMKMPHQTLGPNVSSVAPTTLSILEETGDLVSEPSEISSPIARTKEIVSDSKAYVTSWSACADDQLGIDSKKGGVLTMTLVKLLRDNRNRTNRDMLVGLSEGLFKKGKEAKRYFRKNNTLEGCELPQPKPCLGSLQPTDEIYNDTFIF